MQPIREIWFQCEECAREAYCGAEFDNFDNPDVLCPFCGHVMKLADTRLDRPRKQTQSQAIRQTGRSK